LAFPAQALSIGADMNSRVNIAQPDITLALDLDGVIRGATLAGSMPEGEEVAAWVGRPWAETVGEVAGPKVRRMIEDARTSGVAAFRQVTQRFPSGLELPIEYTAVRLGGASGLLAIGKNLQAVAELQARLVATQQAREQDYWKLREIETRSRLLFDAASEAVLVVRSDTFQVVEANPAAIRALGIAPGWDVMREIAPRDREAFGLMLARAREQGRAPGILVHLGPAEASWTARASLMTSEPGPVLLLQLAPAGEMEPGATARIRAAAAAAAPPPVEALVDQLPDAFVVIDPRGLVRRANQAFLDLVQAASDAVVLGERIGRWLSRPGADSAVLLDALHRHRSVRAFPTTVSDETGGETEAEIAGVVAGEGEARLIGLLIRDVSRRLPVGAETPETLLDLAVRQLTAQVGRTPLVTLVRDTTAVLERHCLKTALAMASGNRTVASELLGLSRQSLYAKLDRYGMDQPADAAGAAEDDG